MASTRRRAVADCAGVSARHRAVERVLGHPDDHLVGGEVAAGGHRRLGHGHVGGQGDGGRDAHGEPDRGQRRARPGSIPRQVAERQPRREGSEWGQPAEAGDAHRGEQQQPEGRGQNAADDERRLGLLRCDEGAEAAHQQHRAGGQEPAGGPGRRRARGEGGDDG